MEVGKMAVVTQTSHVPPVKGKKKRKKQCDDDEEDGEVAVEEKQQELYLYSSDEERLPRAPPNTPQLSERKSDEENEENAPVTPPRAPVLTAADSGEPQTPTRTQVTQRKPPKTELVVKTRSRIELASPLTGLYQTAPRAQSGVNPGCLTVPAKSRAPSRITSAQRIIAVADTNVLLNDLNMVENTQNYNVTLVIPYAVVRELDGLKNGKSLTARDARTALHTLRKWVKAGPHSSVRFQNINEVPKSRSFRGRTRSNDDRILDCCLYYAEVSELEEGQKVILLTNDVALQIKAEIFSAGRNAPRFISAMGMRAFYEKEVWRLL